MSVSKETFKVLEEETGVTSPKKQLKKMLQDTTNWRNIVQKVLEVIPIVYDKAQLWWMWNDKRFCYELTDETDLMNIIDEATTRNTLKGNIQSQIINAFKREGRKNTPEEIPKSWIQFKNKIVDINTGEEFIATPKYFLTNPIPHNIGDTEESPVIDNLLSEWGNDYAITLKEVIAYCCLRDYPLHRIFLLIGSGSNGKGTYLRLLNNFIGMENIASTEMDFLIRSQFHITKLHKKLCCQMSETNFQALKNTSMLKRLSGGDLIGFEYKNKIPFDDYNYAKIIIATNSLPVTYDKTDGFYRRWVIIDFKKQFSEKTDPLINLPESEYEGLARWCCNAIKRLLTNREFTKEGSIAERKERYESRSNPLQSFLKENYERDVNGQILSSQFFAEVSAYLNSNGYRQLTYDVVRGMMKEEGFDYERHRLPLFDNPQTCVIGLKRKSLDVQAVQPVQATSSPVYLMRTNPSTPAHPAQDAQYINKSPKHSHNTLFDSFKNLWTGKIAYKGQAIPIDIVQREFPEITDELISQWINDCLVREEPAGWVKPI